MVDGPGVLPLRSMVMILFCKRPGEMTLLMMRLSLQANKDFEIYFNLGRFLTSSELSKLAPSISREALLPAPLIATKPTLAFPSFPRFLFPFANLSHRVSHINHVF